MRRNLRRLPKRFPIGTTYVVEGHVPIAAIRKLLAERRAITAITLPGMPEGSPGMVGSKQAPFVIYAVAKDGTTSVYMTI